MYNGGMSGLTYWSPNVNIFRDPRWGRGQETPGEDPLLAGKYAASYVRGLQQPHGKAQNMLKVAACCKHFTAYDLDNWKGNDRFHFNAKVSKQDLKDTYNVPFRACVEEGKVASVMCSYNQVNGVPTCADENLLSNTIRREWGLNGYIVSDCDSVGVFYDSQHYTSSAADAAADAIKAGLDLDCGPFLAVHTEEAVKQGKLKEAQVNNALVNTITVQMRLGMFDGEPSQQPFGHLSARHVCTQAHEQLALEAARQGIVLLKNHRHVLPLSPALHRSIAVVGPNADATITMIGNYAGIACRYTSPLQGIGEHVKTIHKHGCRDVACIENDLFDASIDAASRADATVLVMGLDQSVEAETRDREVLLLPGRQQELVSKVAKASKGPVVLVLMCGGPVDVSFAKTDHKVAAILWAGYPGQAGGKAIADVIFGEYNPGGKLPVTWYLDEFTSMVPMTSMDMRSNPTKGYPGRTYRFYSGPVLYPFGHGLSYTSFSHSLAHAPTTFSLPLYGKGTNSTLIRVTHAKCAGLTLPVHVDVSNTGPIDGSHTLLIYSTPPPGRWAPLKQLVAFQKVHVPARSQSRVSFAIHVCKALSVVDHYGVRRIPVGDHSLLIGDIAHSFSLRPESTRLTHTNPIPNP
ncbi:putative beta-D-xylosidase 2 [Cinnamomum micranthum f. kanehirae]|uniref:Putative beta-D-xylosidase 2 n=1 Tax=Cinnamomum micranthum f. kanehirae TaxID=337451 RepID=A0A443PU24_9MAGN|nr:putative beta-D-xylosidase 2 [Cinnamomum micranthum f. kanehirae]